MVNEVLAVELVLVAYSPFSLLKYGFDARNGQTPMGRRKLNGGKHEDYPFFPRVLVVYGLQKAIVPAFILYQWAAEIQNGKVEKRLFGQIENV